MDLAREQFAEVLTDLFSESGSAGHVNCGFRIADF
jgi:hypothetical protein